MRPPRSTPFPTRRSSDLRALALPGLPRRAGAHPPARPGAATGAQRARAHRSEEHTSELQSRQYLVCRLLLEKQDFTGSADTSATYAGIFSVKDVTVMVRL